MLAAVGNRILNTIIMFLCSFFQKQKKKKRVQGSGCDLHSNEHDVPVLVINCFYYLLHN